MNKPANAFGTRLRWWRERRALSQLDLALEADSSQRHLSFLESGRAAPSREMVLRLAAALGMPLRQQNALLLAAGYAPAWRESALDAPAMAMVNAALDHMLAHHEAYPALGVDRAWTLLRANPAALRLTAFLSGAAPLPGASINVADLARGATPGEAPVPVLPIHFRKDGTSIGLFTTIATLGAPQDVTVQGIRIETLFPHDPETASLLRSWSG